MVTGIIGKKVGMTQLFEPDGTVYPATVLKAGPCVVAQVKTVEARARGERFRKLSLTDETHRGRCVSWRLSRQG